MIGPETRQSAEFTDGAAIRLAAIILVSQVPGAARIIPRQPFRLVVGRVNRSLRLGMGPDPVQNLGRCPKVDATVRKVLRVMSPDAITAVR